jgi:hypothetical protein
MAKKTKAVEEPTPDYKEVHDTTLQDVVTGEDKPVEEKKVEPVEDKEIDFDPNEFEAKMEEKVSKISEETVKKIMEASTGKEEPEKEVDKELISPWAKENRTPKDYEEVADWALEKKKILDTREKIEFDKQQEEIKKQSEEQEKIRLDGFNKFIDSQLNELLEAGKLEKTPEARKALFQTMYDVNKERIANKQEPIYSLKEIFYEHYKAPTEQPAGADAPISAGKMGGGTETKDLDYKEVHNKSIFDILTGK